MSIKGRPITWLDAAVKRGDVASAISAAAEMTRGSLSLDYALAIVVLMADGDPDRYDRAVTRWLQRWEAERAPPRAAGDVARWKALLDELPALEAVAALAAVCDRLGLEHAGEAVVHLFPRVR
ncbi:MAG: hypothetical protein REI11_08200 [Patulibacter sp.]|nr:hypothetical protein [Patulibacter sp.]